MRNLLLSYFPKLFNRKVSQLVGCTHRSCRSRQIFGDAKDFCPNLHKLGRKDFLCDSWLQIFSHKDHEDLLRCDLRKHVFLRFSANVGCYFLKSNNVGRHFCPDSQGFCPDFQGFCPDFQGFCPDFWQIKTFGGALAPPPPTPLALIYVSVYI